MHHKARYIFAFCILLAAILACAAPTSATQPAPQNVETIVALTFQALTAPADNAPPPSSSSSLLPHSLYFLTQDSVGHLQVHRLDKDGVTLKQITFEPSNVTDYDASVIDGSVVYVANNQLLNIRADGSNRAVLLDGGAVDQNNPFINRITRAVFSPNGQTIAYGYKGLNFYSIATGQSNLVLADRTTDSGGGFIFPDELIWPEKYSADGSKLIVTLGYYEGASAAIYYPNGGALVRLTGAQGAIICCGDTEWSSDYSAFYSASPTFGMFNAGLWKVDASNGQVTTLLSGNFDSNPVNLADEPFLAPDGQLYYFYGTAPAGSDMINRPALQLVRSSSDGITNRTVLRPETFNFMNEALWSPDGSFVIVANAPIQDVYQGGAVELYYTDGQKTMIPLHPYAQNFKWGP